MAKKNKSMDEVFAEVLGRPIIDSREDVSVSDGSMVPAAWVGGAVNSQPNVEVASEVQMGGHSKEELSTLIGAKQSAIDSVYSEATRRNAEENRAWQRSPSFAVGRGGFRATDIDGRSDEQKNLSAAKMITQRATKTLDTYTDNDLKEDKVKDDAPNFLSQAWSGFINQNVESVTDLFTGSEGSIRTNIIAQRALQKRSEGKPLTESERLIVEAIELSRGSDSYVANRGGATIWAGAGGGTFDSGKYMIETAVSGGANLLSSGVKGLAKMGAKKILSEVGKAAAMEAVRTPLRGSFSKGATERAIDQYRLGENGEVVKVEVPWWELLYKSYATTWSEAFTEQLGTVFPVFNHIVAKGVAKVTPKLFGKELGSVVASKVGSVAGRVKPFWNNMQKVTNLNSFGSEVTEEMINNVLQPILTGEVEQIKENFSSKNLWTMIGSVALMSGGVNIASSPTYINSEVQSGKLRKKANGAIKAIADVELRQNVFEAIRKGRTVEQKAANLSKVNLDNMTPSDAVNIIDGFNFSVRGEMYRGVEVAQDEEAQKFEQKMAFTSRLSEYVNRDSGLYEEIRAEDGTHYALLGGSMDGAKADDALFVKDLDSGEVVQMSASEVVHYSEAISVEQYAVKMMEGIEAARESERDSAQEQSEEAQEAAIEMVQDARESGVEVVEYKTEDRVELSDGTIGEFLSYTPDGRAAQIAVEDINAPGGVLTVDVPSEQILGLAEEVVQSEEQVVGEVEPSPSSTSVPATTEQVAQQRDIPRLKDGTPDYNAMEARVFAEVYGEEFSEQEAVEMLGEQLESTQKRITSLRNSKVTDLNTRAKNRREVVALEAKAIDIKEYLGEVQRVEVEVAKEEKSQNAPSFEVGENIKARYETATKIYGVEHSIYPAGSNAPIKGRFVLTQSGAVTPSHNAQGFAQSEGFPVNENGKTVNDRDYSTDKFAQAQVLAMAATYNGRAIDSPVVVTSDGVVISGNNRTMSGELAAKNGTDVLYVEYLKQSAPRYGFTVEQVEGMESPRVLFEVAQTPAYNTDTFAGFNAQDTKSQNRTEKAVKVGKTMSEVGINKIARIVDGHSTLGDFYSSSSDVDAVLRVLVSEGVVGEIELAELKDGDVLSTVGKDLVENVLVGSVLSENAVRMVSADGMKKYRNRLTKIVLPLLENRALGDYSIIEEVNEAVEILDKARQQKTDVRGVVTQRNAFEEVNYSSGAVMIAEVLQGGKDGNIRDLVEAYNAPAKLAASGQGDMFAQIPSKEDIVAMIGSTRELINGKAADVSRAREFIDVKGKETVIIEVSERFENYAEAKKWAVKNLVGKSFLNIDTKEKIYINRESVNKMTSGKAVNKSVSKDIHTAALRYVPQIIENSILTETHPDKKGNPNVELIQRFVGAIQIDGELYRVKSTVRQMRATIDNPNKLYSYEIQEIEPIKERQSVMVRKSQNDNPTSSTNSTSNEQIEERQSIMDGRAQNDNPTSSTNSIDVTKLIENFDNPTTQVQKSEAVSFRESEGTVTKSSGVVERDIRARLAQMAQMFGVEGVIINDRSELPYNLRYDKSVVNRRFSGLYSKSDGKVYFILPLIESVDDAFATYLHEVVAHKGVDGLLGRDGADRFYEAVFDVQSEELQKELLSKYGTRAVAGDELVATMAEGSVSPSVMQRIIAAVRKFFREMGLNISAVSDNDIRYILFKSKVNLQRARNIAEVMSAIERDGALLGELQLSDARAREVEQSRAKGEVVMTEEMKSIKNAAVARGSFLKAPNGEPTKLSERQWLEVRTSAFKAWFGDWELPHKEVEIVEAQKAEFKNFAEAKEWAKNSIVGVYDNEQTGGKGVVRISQNSINKYLSSPAIIKSDSQEAHLAVLKVLPDVIRTSIDAEQHADYIKDTGGKRTVQSRINPNVTLHRLYGAVELSGEVYRVKVTLKEDVVSNMPKNPYSYEAIKIEMLSGTLANSSKRGLIPRPNNSISTAKLLKDVEKSKEEGAYLLDSHSKVVDVNGEPLVAELQQHSGDIRFREAQLEGEEAAMSNAAQGVQEAPLKFDKATKEVVMEMAIEKSKTQIENDKKRLGKFEKAGNVVGANKGTRQMFAINFQEKIQDRFVRIDLLQRLCRAKGGVIMPWDNFYDNLYKIDSKTQAAMQQYKMDFIDPLENLLQKWGKDIGLTFDEVDEYLLAKASVERHLSGVNAVSEKANGKWTLDKVEQIVENFEYRIEKYVKQKKATNAEKGVKEEVKEDLVELWRLVNATTEEVLNIAVRGDMMSLDDKREVLSHNWKYYVPLRDKNFEHEGEVDLRDVFYTEYRGVSGGKQKVDASKKAKGRSSKPFAALPMIQILAYQQIMKSERNKAMLSLLRLAESNKDMADLWEVKERWLVRNLDGGWSETVDTPPVEEIAKYRDTQRELRKRYEQRKKIRKSKELSAKDKSSEVERIDAEIVTLIGGMRYSRKDKQVGGSFVGADPTKGEVVMLRGGLKYTVRLKDLDVAASINYIEGEWQRWFSKWMGPGTRFMSQLATSKNPQFIFDNLIRDFEQASMYHFVDKNGNAVSYVSHFTHSWGALTRAQGRKAKPLSGGELRGYNVFDKKSRAKLVERYGKKRVWDTMYNIFKSEGGETGYAHLLEPKQMQKKLEREFKLAVSKNSPIVAMKKTFIAVDNALDFVASITENSTRFASFMVQLDMGKTKEEAVNYGKEITVNFNRKGQLAMGLGGLYMFLNAGFQGVKNVWSLVTNKDNKPPKEIWAQRARFLATRAVMVGVAYAHRYALNMMLDALGDDEEGKEYGVSDYVSHTNVILPWTWFGADDDSGMYARVPVAIPLRSAWGLGSLLADYQMGKADGVEVMESYVDMLVGSFSPVPTSYEYKKEELLSYIVKNLTPSTWKPIFEVTIFNHNFMGTPINRDRYGNEYTPDSALAKKNASKLSRVITEGINEVFGGSEYVKAGVTSEGKSIPFLSSMDFSASSLDHLVAGYTLGPGNIGKGIANLMSDGLDGTTKREGVSYKDIPILKRFIGEFYEINPAWEFYEVATWVEEKNRVNKKEAAAGLKSSWYSEEEREVGVGKDAQLAGKLRATKRIIRSLKKQMENYADYSEEWEVSNDKIKLLQYKYNKIYENK